MLKNLALVLLLLTASLTLQGSVRLDPAPSFPLRSTANYAACPALSIPCAGETSLSGFFQVSIAPDGNLVTDGRFNYTWDAENRLVSAIWANHTKVEYCYDYMGRRIEKKVSNWSSESWQQITKLRFVYDGNLLIAVFDASNNLNESYLYGEDLSASGGNSGSLQATGGIGGLIAVTDATDTYFPAYDCNGNVMAYVNATGSQVAEYEYSPSPSIIVKSGPKADDFRMRFSTLPYDQETNSTRYLFRDLSHETGRWFSRDPMGEIISDENSGEMRINLLYPICHNNTIMNTDFLGLDTMLIFIGEDHVFHVGKSIFELAADKLEFNYKHSPEYDPEQDAVVKVNFNKTDNRAALIMKGAFEQAKCIRYIYYFGHGDPDHLFLNVDPRMGANISSEGEIRSQGTPFNSYSLKRFTSINLTQHAIAVLGSCRAGQGIASALSEHLGIPVYASTGGVNYDDNSNLYTILKEPLADFFWFSNTDDVEKRITADRDCCWGQKEADKLNLK